MEGIVNRFHRLIPARSTILAVIILLTGGAFEVNDFRHAVCPFPNVELDNRQSPVLSFLYAREYIHSFQSVTLTANASDFLSQDCPDDTSLCR